MKNILIASLAILGSSIPFVLQDDDSIQDTQKLTSPLVPPQQALEMMELPTGFEATLFASEPDVRQPIAITTDDRGRIWVAECLTYAESKRNFDTRYNDRILIFEDTDGDGKADQRKVFWEGGKRLTSVEVGMGGVWVTCAPEMLFIPDRDGDDVPDGPPEVLLDGWNADFVRHNLVNGLKFGPDGWLYGRHGIQATSHVGPPGASESQRTSLNCCIWKYHPITREFEVVCEGTTNPWGHDWDQHGELFMINTVIGHLWHVVPGARYRRMYGSHFNPYTYEPIEQTADHFHFSGNEEWSEVNKHGISHETSDLGGGHAHCGLMIYQGGNWPEAYRGKAFTANFHGRRINQDSLHRHGNGYTASHAADFMKTKDLWFRGVELMYGPDGGVYLLDWSDIGECHENDGIHRTSGRIFKITYQDAPFDADTNLRIQTNNELIQQLDQVNQWYPRTARKVLQHRATSPESWDEINKLLNQRIRRVQQGLSAFGSEQGRVNYVLQTLWTLQTIGPRPAGPVETTEVPDLTMQLDQPQPLKAREPSWQGALTDRNEHVRALAVKQGKASLEQLLNMASDDPSALVRLYVATELRNLDDESKFKVASALSQHDSDANDRTQPKLIWYLLEPSIASHPQLAIQLAQSTRFPHLRRCIVRRLSAEVDQHPEYLNQLLQLAVEFERPNEILAGMIDSLTGRRSVSAPENWKQISAQLRDHSQADIAQSLAFLGNIFGNGTSTEQLQQIARDPENDPSIRRQAIKAVSEAKPDGLFEFLRGQIRDRSVAVQVVNSMSHCTEDQVANVIINSFATFDLATERAALSTLCTRPNWAKSLLNAVSRGQVPKGRILASHARQIKNLDDAKLDQLLEANWGVIKETSEDRAQMISKIKTTVQRTDISPDFSNGAKLFQQHCASCHVLYGQGGHRGPDLTGSDRGNLAYLLENVIDPSASVADSYRSSVLLTVDGRTLIGVIVDETDATLRLLMPEEEIVIEKSDIEGRRHTIKSLMPDGLLDKLTEQEVVDLFGYLRKK